MFTHVRLKINKQKHQLLWKATIKYCWWDIFQFSLWDECKQSSISYKVITSTIIYALLCFRYWPFSNTVALQFSLIVSAKLLVMSLFLHCFHLMSLIFLFIYCWMKFYWILIFIWNSLHTEVIVKPAPAAYYSHRYVSNYCLNLSHAYVSILYKAVFIKSGIWMFFLSWLYKKYIHTNLKRTYWYNTLLS